MHVVDLKTVTPEELEALWDHQQRLWRHSLLLDASGTLAVLRRLVARQGLAGKAVRHDGCVVAYLCYALAGGVAVILDMVVSPGAAPKAAQAVLLQQAVAQMRQQGVRRIESQCVSDCGPELAVAFAREGFQTYWHECLRLAVRDMSASVPRRSEIGLVPWQVEGAASPADVLRAAYNGTVESAIHQRYRSLEGCREVLESITSQGGCGTFIEQASALARHRGQVVGLIMITEGLARHAHLPQIAVTPAYQGRGIGRLLLDYSLSHLAGRHFDTLSLIACRHNTHATEFYRRRGFRAVLAFPLFAWDR